MGTQQQIRLRRWAWNRRWRFFSRLEVWTLSWKTLRSLKIFKQIWSHFRKISVSVMWKLDWEVEKSQIIMCGRNVRNDKMNLDNASGDSKWVDSDYLGGRVKETWWEKGDAVAVSGLDDWASSSTIHPGIKEKSLVRSGEGVLDLLCSLGIQVKISNRLLLYGSGPSGFVM